MLSTSTSRGGAVGRRTTPIRGVPYSQGFVGLPRSSGEGDTPLKTLLYLSALTCSFLCLARTGRAADNPDPPSSPVKLIFVHHSTGENWLSDSHGELGIGLANNNYFVSDTNYGWGPDSIGDTTDIGHWWTWFRGPNSGTYMAALFAESGQHCSYTRGGSDPGGPNEIVMIKSCFPNSALQGDPGDPVPPIDSNPLRGEASWSSAHTVANAKGIYVDLLEYFALHQEKLFVVIAAPPLQSPDWASNARAFNQWLVNDWLATYPYHNVFVFDFYNVLTTNGGDENTNDLGSATGNHHRWWSGAVQHKTDGDNDPSPDVLEYWSPGNDDHPSPAGGRKATAEFLPLLNVAYHRWKDASGTVATSLYTLDRVGVIGEAALLRAYLSRVSDGAAIAGQPIAFSVGGSGVGSGVTGATGRADLLWTITAGPETRPILAEFAGDATYLPSSATATLTAQTWATKMVAFDRTARIAGVTELKARLVRSDDAPLYNKAIDFSVDGTFVITRPTSVSGYASYPYYHVPDGAGTGGRAILAEWAGDGGYLASSGVATLSVLAATPYIWVLPRSVPQGGIARLYAYFRRLPDYQKQEGKPVTFRIDGTWIADVVTLTGAEAGIARYQYATVEPVGEHTIRCEFAGDAWIEAGCGEANLTIY